MKRCVPLMAALLLVLTPAVASAITYDCELKAESRLGWIPSRLIIVIGDDETRAVVYDGYIHRRYGKPIPAKLERSNAEKFKLSWRVDNMEISNRTNTINGDFVANLNTRTMRITMRTFLSAADFLPRGRGTCEIAK